MDKALYAVQSPMLFPQDQPDGQAGLARGGGMTLWEYYAAYAPAIPAHMVVSHVLNRRSSETLGVLATWAFDYADAMMKERDRRVAEALATLAQGKDLPSWQG